MSSTINCITCFQKATCWSGHVHNGSDYITAGFCKTHFKKTERPAFLEGCKGCYGTWKEEMGEDKSFGQLMYIDRDGVHPADDEEEDDD